MCGISVIIDSKNKKVHEAVIQRMNDLIKHRGPDGEGFYFDDHVALGQRMLKITDFSVQGKQPMSYMHYVIVHNGEIYNFREIRENLRQSGYTFHTMSDTEVIMAAYDKWGSDCLKHFIGMWSFVLLDTNKKIFFCSRDRFGIKPLFYAQLGNKLILGSEIKQLTAFDDFTPRINYATAFNFLYHGKIESVNESFFEGVNFLPAGHNLTYSLQSHTFSITQWYDINKVKRVKPTSFKESSVVFKDLFTKSLLLHGESKLPVGACLSGGLDSTSIVGVSKKINNQLTTFSSCYTQHGYNEIEYINDAVMHYKFTNHKNYPNIHELIDNGLLKKIVYHQDQPILSGSFFSEYKVFENAANNDFRIMLSGQGADEYLGGYGEFSLVNLLGLLKKAKLVKFAGALKDTASRQNQPVKDLLASFIVSGMGIPRFTERANKQLQLAAKGYLNTKWINEPGNGFDISKYRSLSDLSKDALKSYSLPHQLLSEDRNSMMNSIESRLPFLDHRLVEFCLALPDNYIIRNGATKAVLRESLKDTLPPKVYSRHSKLGFPGPEEALFKHNYEFINGIFKECIHLFPGIFSPQLADMHAAYYNNKISYNNILFRTLAFATWAKEFNLMASPVKPVKTSAKI